MPLWDVIVVLAVVGVVIWLINTYLPMDRTIKRILNIVIIFAVVLWLLHVFGLLDSLRSLTI